MYDCSEMLAKTLDLSKLREPKFERRVKKTSGRSNTEKVDKMVD